MIACVLFNAITSLALFFLNGQLGRLQYGIAKPLFEYGSFTFETASDQKFSGNFFQKTFNPAIFMALIAALTQRLLPILAQCLPPALGQRLLSAGFLESLWLFVPMFWGIRLLYMIGRNSFIFLNRKYEALAFALSLALGEGVFFLIIMPLVRDGASVWIPATELRDALWFAILAYIFKTAWDILKQFFDEDNLYSDGYKHKVVDKQYKKFSKKYGADISKAAGAFQDRLSPTDLEQMIRLVYAIMIFEDFNRSWAIRFLERLYKAIFRRHLPMSLGIMQVQTRELISDRQSIKMAIERISRPFLNGDSCPVDTAISQYNCGIEYWCEIVSIYDILEYMIPSDQNGPVG